MVGTMLGTKKLLNPDYNGTRRGNGSDRSDKFEMHILKRSPQPARWTVGDVPDDIDNIEGIILDNTGIAVFSGRINKTTSSLEFTTIYSNAAVKDDIIEKTVYKGLSQRTGGFKGDYKSPEECGSFKLTKAGMLGLLDILA